jgi:hypothetical protein
MTTTRYTALGPPPIRLLRGHPTHAITVYGMAVGESIASYIFSSLTRLASVWAVAYTTDDNSRDN